MNEKYTQGDLKYLKWLKEKIAEDREKLQKNLDRNDETDDRIANLETSVMAIIEYIENKETQNKSLKGGNIMDDYSWVGRLFLIVIFVIIYSLVVESMGLTGTTIDYVLILIIVFSGGVYIGFGGN